MLLSNLVTFTQRVLHILFIKPVDTTRENPTFLWEFCIKTIHNSDLQFSAMIHFESSTHACSARRVHIVEYEFLYLIYIIET